MADVTIKSVAVIGAGGNVGQAVLPLFLESPIDVTVISRQDSKSTFPPEVKVIKTEYTLASLTESLRGHDAVLCLIDATALDTEFVIIDAAVASGVKWFVPSEFGHDTTNPKVLSVLPYLRGKVRVTNHLKSKEKDGLGWTAIVTGLFFDWGLSRGVLDFDVKEGSARIWDNGSTPFSATNVHTIGLALLHLLTSSSAREAARNKHVHISSFATSQNEILAELERATGTKFTVAKVAGKRVKAEAQERLKKGDSSAVKDILQYIAWGEEELSLWTEEKAEGNKELLAGNSESIRGTVESVVRRLGAERKENPNHL